MDDEDHDTNYESDLEETLAQHDRQLRIRALGLVKLAGGNAQDAEDLYGDTICRILSYPKEPGAIANMFGYILCSMRNLWLDQQVKANKVHMESLDAIQEDPARQGELPVVQPEVLRIAKNNELLQELNNVGGALTSDEKLLVSALLHGKTLEDLAAAANEDVLRTQYRWRKLMAKIKRLIKCRNAKGKGPGRP